MGEKLSTSCSTCSCRKLLSAQIQLSITAHLQRQSGTNSTSSAFGRASCSMLRTFSVAAPAASTGRRSVAKCLQLSAFAFRHGKGARAGFQMQCRMPGLWATTSPVWRKVLPSLSQEPAALRHVVRLPRTREEMRPLSVSLEGVPHPYCVLRCLSPHLQGELIAWSDAGRFAISIVDQQQ